MLYLTDPNAFGGTVRFLPNIPDFNAPNTFVDLLPGNRYSENERGLGPSEMADALLHSKQTFRTSKELGLHVLEVLQGMLDSGADRTIHRMTTTCSRPEPFYTLN